jgi:hypothetical protein
MIIFAFLGYAGHGKTTAAAYLYDYCLQNGSTRFLAFGDAVKEEVSLRYGFDRILCDTQEGKVKYIDTDMGYKTVRETLVLHSTTRKKLEGDDYWAKQVIHKIELVDPDFAVIHDLRFKAEYKALTEAFPKDIIVTIRIVNPTAPISDCHSEHDMDDFTPIHTIQNDSTISVLYSRLSQIFNVYIGSSV